MRVLLIADACDGLLDLALQAQALGHQVRLFVRKYDPRTRPVGKGLVERVTEWRPSMRWADLVVLEANGFSMIEFGIWRKRGVPIIGGDDQSAAWELDRSRGMEVFREAGIEVPPYREFNDYDQAIRYVERRGEPLYSKPCSDTADKSLSAKTGVPEDPTWMLRKWKKKHGRPPCPFLLQDAISGVEVGVGCWWGPGGWGDAWETNFEGKRLMSSPDGNGCGPNTGEMHTVLYFSDKAKLAEKVLVPLEPQLEKLSGAFCVDVNVIVDDEGTPWPLEFTMRCGWPSFNIETALFESDPVEFLYAVANGEPTAKAHILDSVAVGLVVALPPYPHPPRDYEETIGVPIYGDTDQFHPCEVQAGTDTDYAAAGHYLGVVTGVGDTVRQAANRARAGFEKLSIPISPFYRDDAGRRLRAGIPKLQAHGYATDLKYS